MKLFMASLATETNSFSPIPTGWSGFKEALYTKRASLEPPTAFAAPLNVWRKRAEELGWEVVEGLATFAQPAGPTVRSVYEAMRDDILADLKATLPVDVVLISMHGSMMAEGYPDCEGDTLGRIRDVIGPDAIIGVELDLHCLITDEMMSASNVIVCFKEYPHVDITDRAEEVFTLSADAASGKTNPVMRDYDCRMVSILQTPREPMRSFVDEMIALEAKPGVLSVSLGHGFPWADHPRTGARTLVITDGNEDQAQRIAHELGNRLWSLREDLRLKWPNITDGLKLAAKAKAYPVVLADFADNAGGGAPSDSTFVLREVIDQGLKDIVLGIYWDPIVVRMCEDAGVGAVLNLRIGGKICAESGEPVDLRATVRAIKPRHVQHLGSAAMPLGTCVWLESGGMHLMLSELRSQTFHPEAFTGLGIELDRMKVIVVKSSQHFYAGFSPIASQVIHMATPGTMAPAFASLPYTRRDLNYWPRVDHPNV